MPNIRKINRERRTTPLRKLRKTCKECGIRQAFFIRRVKVIKPSGETLLGKRSIIKSDRYHDLCLQCQRSISESNNRRRYH